MDPSNEILGRLATIELSKNAHALLEMIKEIKPRQQGLIGEEYNVSQTVSFFGFIYEKLRNAVEFNDEHLIRRLAISRILRRRLQINPEGKGEGENVIRELLWGKYLPQQFFTQQDVLNIQTIITKYVVLKREIYRIHVKTNRVMIHSLIVEMMSCEIEEMINWENTQRRSAYLYFFFQTLKDKILIKNTSDEMRDKLFYIASERAYLKNDDAFIKYHLFILIFDRLINVDENKLPIIAEQFGMYTQTLAEILKNRHIDLLVKFAKKQLPPFKILATILDKNLGHAEGIITNEGELRKSVEETCDEKYNETGTRLRNAAIRSITYIFLTKMIFVMILEFPLTRLIYGTIEVIPLIVNTLFPPLLMGIIVFFINPPSNDNTRKIYVRIIDILNKDISFETEKVEIKQRFQMKKPSLLFTFSVLYLITFTVVFGSIFLFLDLLDYTILSKAVFLFFLCVVAFFGYRIRQTAKEYVVESKNNVIINLFAFLFLPILYVGKFLSSQISRINIFIIIFDSLIEAPFKFFIEVIEEWTRFIKARKDELI